MIDNEQLLRECRRFSRYLMRHDPTDYIVRKYVQAHKVGAVRTEGDRFDDYLVRAATSYRLLTGPAAAYARLFGSRRLLQRKLVLLLAILETCSPSYRFLEPPTPLPVPKLLTRVLGRACLALMSLFAGTLIFGPMQMALRARPWLRA